MPQEISLTLNPQSVQYILNLLAEKPWKEVDAIIKPIMEQSTAQIEAANKPAQEASGA